METKDECKFYGQQCQDEELNKKFRELHVILVDQVIDFCKANNITIDEFDLHADGLEVSIENGSWQSCTDSALTFRKFSDEHKKFFWKMDFDEYLKTHTKDELNKYLDRLEEEARIPFMFSI